MPNLINCPACQKQVSEEAPSCPNCGQPIRSQSTAHGLSIQSPPVQQTWNPGVAAVLSLFIPGAGQMYKSQIGRGFTALILTVVGYCIFIIPGIILHIVFVFDAAANKPEIPTLSSDNQAMPENAEY